ncbi:MAG: RsmD family RNA methyltransferase [Oligoflexales bacterium]|nr:RsmD family RNA methyltransferase [Oligoflexales bacterium]
MMMKKAQPVRQEELMPCTHASQIEKDALRSLLLTKKRYEILSLSFLKECGRVFFDDENAISLFDLTPDEYYSRGIRISGQTCIECVVDKCCREITGILDFSKLDRSLDVHLVDMFSGSGNMFFHFCKRLDAKKRTLVESDPNIWMRQVENFRAIDFKATSICGDWTQVFKEENSKFPDMNCFLISPPWGDGFSFSHGLDLLKTSPSVVSILRSIESYLKVGSIRNSSAYCFVHLYEVTTPGSLAFIHDNFDVIDQKIGKIMPFGSNIGFMVVKISR